MYQHKLKEQESQNEKSTCENGFSVKMETCTFSKKENLCSGASNMHFVFCPHTTTPFWFAMEMAWRSWWCSQMLLLGVMMDSTWKSNSTGFDWAPSSPYREDLLRITRCYATTPPELRGSRQEGLQNGVLFLKLEEAGVKWGSICVPYLKACLPCNISEVLHIPQN